MNKRMINFTIGTMCALLLALSSTLMVSSSAPQLRVIDTPHTTHMKMAASEHDHSPSHKPGKHEHSHSDCPFCRELDAFILSGAPQTITRSDTHPKKVQFWYEQSNSKTHTTHKYAARAPPVVHI
jgi:hypothetical protein